MHPKYSFLCTANGSLNPGHSRLYSVLLQAHSPAELRITLTLQRYIIISQSIQVTYNLGKVGVDGLLKLCLQLTRYGRKPCFGLLPDRLKEFRVTDTARDDVLTLSVASIACLLSLAEKIKVPMREGSSYEPYCAIQSL